VTTVAGIDTDVTDVAAIDSNVTTVAGISSDVSTVAGISANVTTVAGIDTEVTAVAGNASNINQVASDTAVINSASANATSAAASATAAASSATDAATSAAQANAVVTGVSVVRHSIRPSLLLDFANSKTLDPRIDFTRSSTATYYDGKTFAKAEENLLKYSQEFDAGWGNYGVTQTANATTAPDGTTTAEAINEGTGTSIHVLEQIQNVAVAGNRYVFSIYAKDVDAQYIELSYSESNNNYAGAEFNLTAETSTTFNAGSDVAVSSSITSVGSGWYRCVLIFDCGVSGNNFYVMLSDGTSARNTRSQRTYTGTSRSLYIWGAQLEQRDSVTAYTPTTSQPITNYIPVLQTAASGAARFDHDPVTGESKGLLIEEQRTNLEVYSEDFSNAAWTKSRATITSNTIVAPDGTLSGDKLIVNDTETAGYVIDTISFTSGTTYTHSIYAKAGEVTVLRILAQDNAFGSNQAVDFDLSAGTASISYGSPTFSIEDVGNDWYRCSVTAPATASIASGFQVRIISTGDGYSGIYLWGAQLEVGTFPTSYIPTSGSQVTRSADAASMTGTNFSDWYRQDEGSIYTEGSIYSLGNCVPFAINDGSGYQNAIESFWNNTSHLYVRAYGSAQANIDAGSVVAGNTNNKLAASFATNDFAVTLNSGTVASDTSGSMPVNVNQLNIGRGGQNIYVFNGHIKKLAYYPARLTNAELQALTED
jgi:hypothetical protein